MPRRIILVGAKGTPGGDIEVTYCFWVPVAPTFQPLYADVAFVSAVPTASAAELVALRAGVAVELKRSRVIPSTIAFQNVKDQLIQEYESVQVYQSTIRVPSVSNVSWDGVTWSS